MQQKRRKDLRAGRPGSGRGAELEDFGRTRRSLPIINAPVFLEYYITSGYLIFRWIIQRTYFIGGFKSYILTRTFLLDLSK